MSTTQPNAQVVPYYPSYTNSYCGTAILALLVYDWLLCLSQEVRFIWNWRSRGVTVSSLVYIFNRYPFIISMILGAATLYPMSDLSCRANIWTQAVMEILCLIANSTFSALRAYALSNRSRWLAAMIILLALPPVGMYIVKTLFGAPENLPSPLGCTDSNTLSPILSTSVLAVARASQFTAELLVVGITWWYSYQSYCISKGIKLGRTISSFLLYNGSMYFLFLAALYIVDLILGTSPIPMNVDEGAGYFDMFIDPMVSVLVCHFMLSLRRFDNTAVSTTHSQGVGVLEYVAKSTVLEFAALPSSSLPATIASFAHPVHVNATLSKTDPDDIAGDNGSEEQEIDVVVPEAQERPSSPVPTSEPSQPAELPDIV